MEHLRVNVNGLALDLVGPAAVIADARGDGADVAAGHADALPVVERLDGGEQVEVGLDEVGELEHHLAPGAGGHLPPDRLERLASRRDGEVHVLLRRLRHVADDLLRRRVDHLERLLVDALDPFVVDEAGFVVVRQ